MIIIAIYTLLSVYCMWRIERTNMNFYKNNPNSHTSEQVTFIIYLFGFLGGVVLLVNGILIYGISVLHWNRNIFNGEKLK